MRAETADNVNSYLSPANMTDGTISINDGVSPNFVPAVNQFMHRTGGMSNGNDYDTNLHYNTSAGK